MRPAPRPRHAEIGEHLRCAFGNHWRAAVRVQHERSRNHAVVVVRMQRLDSGEVLLTLKKRWNDGTFAKLFQPQDLISIVDRGSTRWQAGFDLGVG